MTKTPVYEIGSLTPVAWIDDGPGADPDCVWCWGAGYVETSAGAVDCDCMEVRNSAAPEPEPTQEEVAALVRTLQEIQEDTE